MPAKQFLSPIRFRRSVFRSALSDQSGASAVEFAIVIPIFLIAMMGIFQLGWMGYTQTRMEAALAAATRSTVLDSAVTDADVEQFIKDVIDDPDKITGVTFEEIDEKSGFVLTEVEVSYEYDFELPMVYSAPITLTATGTFLRDADE